MQFLNNLFKSEKGNKYVESEKMLTWSVKNQHWKTDGLCIHLWYKSKTKAKSTILYNTFHRLQ